jgi:hypothetical protein
MGSRLGLRANIHFHTRIGAPGALLGAGFCNGKGSSGATRLEGSFKLTMHVLERNV